MKQTARETIDQLLEVLTAAIAEVQREPQDWKADACAGRWMRNELAPIIERLVERAAENGMPCTCLPARVTLNDGPNRITRPGELNKDCPQHGSLTLMERLPKPCPQCGVGEEIEYPLESYPRPPTHPSAERRRPLGATYDCGHWITFPANPHSSRSVMPMHSNMRITGTAQVSARPLGHAFRPDRIVIADYNDWWVENILVGGQTLLDGTIGRLPGRAFAPRAERLDMPTTVVAFPAIPAGVDLTMTVAPSSGRQ